MSVNLSGQVGLVTGASSGIGLGIAHALARAGAAVAINHHSHAEPAEHAASEIVAAGGRARAFSADVSQEADVVGLLDAVTKTWGSLDIVVANAGAQKDAPVGDMTLEQWNGVIGLDLTGRLPVRPGGDPQVPPARAARGVQSSGQAPSSSARCMR